jgi:hypothetical protein
MLLQKMKELIEGEPETFKQLYESIFGAQIINTVVAGSPAPERIEELTHDLENKIYSSDFWKNSDNEKIKSLVDGILDPCIPEEERKQLLADALDEAVKSHKGSMIFKQQEYNPSKSVGMRDYYKILANCINEVITRSTYEAIPFRFIYIPSKKQLRLEAEAIAGKYRNNGDGIILDFDYLNKNLFGSRMYITTERQGNEMVFYYTRMNGNVIAKQYEITTMSLTDYEKAKNKKQPTLIIKTN